MDGKCPKCEAVVSRAIVNTLDLEVVGGQSYLGVSYSCPACHTILSVQMDPMAVKDQIVTDVVSFLRTGSAH
jgi:phage FluMu protein Com